MMANDQGMTRGVSNPNNDPRYMGSKDVARKEQMSYKRSNVSGQSQKRGRCLGVSKMARKARKGRKSKRK
jgi:hypothetical protein